MSKLWLTYSCFFRWETFQVRVWWMWSEVCQLQRPEEALPCAHLWQALQLQGAGLWQVLHPPLQPQEAHEGARQGGGLEPRGQRGQRQWGVRQLSQLWLQPAAVRNRFCTSGRGPQWGCLARVLRGRLSSAWPRQWRRSSGVRRSSRCQVWESSSSPLHRGPHRDRVLTNEKRVLAVLTNQRPAAIFWSNSNDIHPCDDQTSVNYENQGETWHAANEECPVQNYIRWPNTCSTISVRSCLKYVIWLQNLSKENFFCFLMCATTFFIKF